jgi:hypothetical protein
MTMKITTILIGGKKAVLDLIDYFTSTHPDPNLRLCCKCKRVILWNEHSVPFQACTEEQRLAYHRGIGTTNIPSREDDVQCGGLCTHFCEECWEEMGIKQRLFAVMPILSLWESDFQFCEVIRAILNGK